MFARAVSAAANRAVRSAISSSSSLRPLSTTSRVASAHGPPPPQLYGPGAKAGEVPGIHEQSTGLERLQYLGELEGIPVFDTSPLDASRLGTQKDPVLVPSASEERLVGCTGFPADSHDVLWFPLMKGRQHRCLECGSVYQMDYYGLEDHGDHHH